MATRKVGKYKLSNKEKVVYEHDVDNSTAATYAATDYGTFVGGVNVGGTVDPGTSNLHVTGSTNLLSSASIASSYVVFSGLGSTSGSSLVSNQLFITGALVFSSSHSPYSSQDFNVLCLAK